MNGWYSFIAGVVCLCGMLSFLRTVACAIGAADGALRGLEERYRRERKSAG